jgi:hypothetical protein
MQHLVDVGEQDVDAQAAEMAVLFAQMVRADREVTLRFARARVARFRNEDDAERLFSVPVASLVVARNIGHF